MKKRLFLWFLIFTVAIALIGCGSGAKSETSAAADREVSVQYSRAVNGQYTDVAVTAAAPSAAEQPKASADGGSENGRGESAASYGTNTNAGTGEKIIFTGQVNYQTLDFEKTQTDLRTYMASIGAYIQTSSVKGGGIGYEGLKSAQYVFRIPKTRYDQAFIDMKKFGTVVYEQSTGEDISDRYFDTEARLKSLQIQHERLLELLKKATKMEDILKIENQLQTTVYDIENLTGTLKKWDSLVEYSTLSVNIDEVEAIKPVKPTEKDGLFTRIASGFKGSLNGMWDFTQSLMVFLAAALPIVIPLAIIAFIGFRIYRRKAKKRNFENQQKKALDVPEEKGPENN